MIGITSAVRHSLEVAAAGNGTHAATQQICDTVSAGVHAVQRICHTISVEVPNSSSQEVVVELAINAGGVLLLVVAFWLVGQGRAEKAAAV